MNVSDALTFLKGAYQATLSPCNPYRRAGDVVAQAINDLQSRCRVLENSRESRILALQEQIAKSAALQAERDAIATQLAAARQVGDERLRLLNEIVPRCQLLERAGQVSEEFRKDPQNHVRTWGASYTKTVVAGLAEAWEAAPPHSSARRLIGYASDLLVDYHKTNHVVYQDRDAARARHDKVAAELSKLRKELRSRVREQLLEISSQFGAPAARAIFVSAAPGKSCLADVDDSAMPALLVALAREVGTTHGPVAPPAPHAPESPSPREVHIETRVHVNLQNMPRKAVDGDLCSDTAAVDEAAKARSAARLRFLKTLARWRNPDARPRVTSFTLLMAIEEFIKALK